MKTCLSPDDRDELKRLFRAVLLKEPSLGIRDISPILAEHIVEELMSSSKENRTSFRQIRTKLKQRHATSAKKDGEKIGELIAAAKKAKASLVNRRLEECKLMLKAFRLPSGYGLQMESEATACSATYYWIDWDSADLSRLGMDGEGIAINHPPLGSGLEIKLRRKAEKPFSYLEQIAKEWQITTGDFVKTSIEHLDVVRNEMTYDGLLAGCSTIKYAGIDAEIEITPVWYGSYSYLVSNFDKPLSRKNDRKVSDVFPPGLQLPHGSTNSFGYSAPLQPLKIGLLALVEDRNGTGSSQEPVEYAFLPTHSQFRNELPFRSGRTMSVRAGVEFETLDEINDLDQNPDMINRIALRMLYQETGLKARSSEVEWKTIIMSPVYDRSRRINIPAPMLLGVVRPTQIHDPSIRVTRDLMKLIFRQRKFKTFADEYSTTDKAKAFVPITGFREYLKKSEMEEFAARLDPVAKHLMQLLEDQTRS